MPAGRYSAGAVSRATFGVLPENSHTHQTRAVYGGDKTHAASYDDLTLTVVERTR